jgi:hypothetical protein
MCVGGILYRLPIVVVYIILPAHVYFPVNIINPALSYIIFPFSPNFLLTVATFIVIRLLAAIEKKML